MSFAKYFFRPRIVVIYTVRYTGIKWSVNWVLIMHRDGYDFDFENHWFGSDFDLKSLVWGNFDFARAQNQNQFGFGSLPKRTI